jgi:hypothetical protein
VGQVAGAGLAGEAPRRERDHAPGDVCCEAHLNWALITLMARRLTRKKPVPGWTKKQTATG